MLVIEGQSWSGEDSKQSFTPEGNKEVEIIIFFNNVKEEDFIKLTEDDIDDIDVTEDDIDKYDEYRATRDFEVKITNYANGLDDVGYIELTIDYIENI